MTRSESAKAPSHDHRSEDRLQVQSGRAPLSPQVGVRGHASSQRVAGVRTIRTGEESLATPKTPAAKLKLSPAAVSIQVVSLSEGRL